MHGLLYSGDILQVLALSGFLLILIYPLSNYTILILATLCLVQLPLVLMWMLNVLGGVTLPQALPDTFEIYATGSFTDVIGRNLWYGQAGKWLWMTESGRIWNVVGLFLIGFVLGRIRFFELYRENLKACFISLLVLVALVLFSNWLQPILSSDEQVGELIRSLLGHYINNGLTIIGTLLFLFAYEVQLLNRLMRMLAPCGRMSLTMYVGQSLFGVPLFYGFGLGLYQGFGQWPALLLGLVLWGIQMVLAHWWFARYHYGPLEWVWRSATYLSTNVAWKRSPV